MKTNDLNAIMEITIGRYKNMLEKFTPCKPGSGEFLEQNLITNFALAYTSLEGNKHSNVYTEIPFMCDENSYWKCRADLYIENGEHGYILEAKGSQKGNTLFELIEKDIERLRSDGLKKSFTEMAKDNKRENLPKNMHGIIIADFWGTKNENPDQNKHINMWKNNEFLETSNLKQLIKLDPYLINIKSDYTYWFLAGIIELNW